MVAKALRLTEANSRKLPIAPTLLSDNWRARATQAGTQRAAKIVADHVAEMTDRNAMYEHRRLTDISANGWWSGALSGVSWSFGLEWPNILAIVWSD